MNRFRLSVALSTLLTLAAFALPGYAGTAVVPSAYANVEGERGQAGLTRQASITFQMVIDHSALHDALIMDGSVITGISFRLNEGNTFGGMGYADYEIYIGPSSLAAANTSNTFADNILGGNAARTQVHDGAISLPAGYFSDTAGAPNAFAAPFSFSTGYAYNSSVGQGLVIEIHHDTGNQPANYLLDALNVGTPGLAAKAQNGMGATTAGGISFFPVIQFHGTIVVPEPGTFALAGLGLLPLMGILTRRRNA